MMQEGVGALTSCALGYMTYIAQTRLTNFNYWSQKWGHAWIFNGLTDNAGYENTRHEFVTNDKYRIKIDYITLEYVFLLNF